jgi:PPK2 family polyphosphate:nucleotide phosphotransferase
VDPQGVKITSFKAPTEEERSHDFLWRIRKAVPEPGYIGVFDRSHYEDVLIVRVRSLVPESTWQGRYEEINRWESELVAGGTALVKVMLHLSYEEQARRLAARLDDPTKHWKYNPADLDERALWSDYQVAYGDMLSRCSTQAAPWYVVPADRKWYRDWAVARLLLATFQDLRLSYPPASFDVAAEQARLAVATIG